MGWVGVGKFEVGSSFREVVLWEAPKLGLGALGGRVRGRWAVLCGGEVELQQARPGRASGRGSGMGELVGGWRLVVFRKVSSGRAKLPNWG